MSVQRVPFYVRHVGEDYFGRKKFKGLYGGLHGGGTFVEVDGQLHFTSADGEPEAPISGDREVIFIDNVLTREKINTLKKAKGGVVFFYRRGRSYINCIMDSNDRDKDVEMDCDTEINNYGGWSGTHLGEVIHGSYSITHPTWDDEWNTILQILRPGDEIKLNWLANNSNQYLTKNGIYQDQLKLVIYRGEGKSRKKLSFHIGQSQCENNTAKMIKHTSTPKSIIGDY